MKIPRQKSLALLAFLSLADREQPREKLATLLWPDSSDSRARQAVRTALSDIRRAIGADHLSADSETAALRSDTGIWIDTKELELLAQDPLRELSPAFRFAPFLEGFNLKDAPDFDDWAAFERDRILQLEIRILRARADAFESRSDWKRAIAAAQQSLQLDPVHEDTHRQLMRLYNTAGDRAAAIQQFQTAKRILERELGVEPLPETRAVYEQISSQSTPISVSPAPPRKQVAARRAESELPFVGRDAELTRMAQRVALARNGSGGFVFVEGEAGVGKTRFVNEALGRWEQDTCVLRGTAHQLENNQPYHAFIDLMRDYLSTRGGASTIQTLSLTWLSELGRLLPELHEAVPNLPPSLRLQAAQERSGMIDAEQERSRLFEAVSRAIELVAKNQLVILFIDDIQWADPSSVSLLAHLSDAITREHVLIICTYRAGEANRELENLIHVLSRAGTIEQIDLGRLGEAEVAGLAKTLCRAEAPEFSAWLYRETEGNPFFIREMIAYLFAKGIKLADAPDWNLDSSNFQGEPPVGLLPTSILDLIRARLNLVSARARQILDAAGIIGRSFDFDTLGRASGQDQDTALDALDELLQAQLVMQKSVSDEPYEFSHTKIREVVIGDMSLARQRILHRRVGEALEATHRERLDEILGVLAQHFRVAQEWQRAARYALAAGRHAFAVSAPQEALEFYTSTLESLSHLQDRENTARAYLGMGDAYSALARQDRSLESYDHALAIFRELGDRESVGAVLFGMAQTHLLRAEYQQASELAQEGLATLQQVEQSSPLLVARGQTLWGTALSMGGQLLAEAESHLLAAIEILTREGDYAGLTQPQFELGNIAAQKGDLDRAVDLYEQALENAHRGKELMFEALASNNAAYHRLLRGDIERAEELAKRGLATAEAHDILPALVYLYSTAAEIQIARHEWDRAEEFLNRGMALAERLKHQERQAGYLANLAEVSWGRGEHENAIEKLEHAAQIVDEAGVHYASARYHLRLAEFLAERDDLALAAVHLQRAMQIAREGSFGRLVEQAKTLQVKLKRE